LGYLFSGVVIGPFVLGLVGKNSGEVMHFAEFGVVLMLFLIGLELQPSLLWKMRKTIFGLGGLQVVITSVVIAVASVIFQVQINKAIAIGLILALSSTAIVLQTLTEKGLLKNMAGRSAFSVLLFQDIAVIPILAILPLLAALGTPGNAANSCRLRRHFPYLLLSRLVAVAHYHRRYGNHYFFRPFHCPPYFQADCRNRTE
jgi:Kef-type K+ transport system membrane component KefB